MKEITIHHSPGGTMKPSSNSAYDDEPIYSCLELVAKQLSLKGGSTMTGTPPKIVPESSNIDDKYAIVHWSDAYKMDIHDGEPALIIRRRVEEGITNYISVVCNIRVSAQPASNGRKTQKRGQGVSSKIGEIYLSYEPATRLRSEDSNTQTKLYQNATGAETITYTSPSKSTFSFSKGGGGESLITPQPSSSGSKFSFAKGGDGTPTISHIRSPPLNTQNTKHTPWNVLMVPLINLPPQLICRLCPDAKKIYIRPINTNSKPTTSTTIDSYFTSSSQIIQQLIIVKYQDMFIQSQDGVDADGNMVQYETISISFRGQIEHFLIVKVVAVLSMNEDESNLLSSFGRLHVSEEGGSEKVSESEEQLHTFLQCHIQDRGKKNDYDTSKAADIACRVTRRTVIDFAMYPTTAVVGTSRSDTSRKPCESTTFCAGLDTTLARIKNALLPPLLHPNIFPSGGPLRPPKGALLYGPAGVGKSLMAAQIAYDLGQASSNIPHAKVNVIQIQCANILSSTAIVGEAERLLTSIFDEAEKCKAMGYVGTLVILDDVHLICPRRGGGSGVDQIASTLLALLDGIGSSSSQASRGTSLDSNRLVVLAITTEPSLLDPALRRPGRLDVEIEVAVPDDKARADILRFHLLQIMPSQQVEETDYNALARLAKGFTGADCKLAVKEAVRISISRLPRPVDTTCSTGSTSPTSYEIKYNDLVHAIRITKPSAIKSVAVEVPKVPWSAIGGMDDVKALLKESIELPLTHPHLFEMMHVPPPKGILLYGPPGCSKTLMARAIATEGNMNFLAVKGPELLSKWLGESERALASLFRRARLAAPSVIFFDELDSIASKRGEGGGGSGDRLLSQLLTELDGVTSGGVSLRGKSPPRVVVVGATNRPDVLDPALTRPGRMDRMIYVGLPDKQGRCGIFKIGLTGKDCHEDVDLDVLASDDISKGYTGAEIIALCRDAALHAIGEMDDGIITKPQIHMNHLLMSIKDMKPRTTPEMLRFYESFRGRH